MSTASLGGLPGAGGRRCPGQRPAGPRARKLLDTLDPRRQSAVQGPRHADGAQGRDRGHAHVTVVAPRKAELEELQKKWDKEIKPLLKKERRRERPPSSPPTSTTSVHNLSSIVVLVESQGKRMLLTGDGRGDHTLEGSRRRSCSKERQDRGRRPQAARITAATGTWPQDYFDRSSPSTTSSPPTEVRQSRRRHPDDDLRRPVPTTTSRSISLTRWTSSTWRRSGSRSEVLRRGTEGRPGLQGGDAPVGGAGRSGSPSPSPGVRRGARTVWAHDPAAKPGLPGTGGASGSGGSGAPAAGGLPRPPRRAGGGGRGLRVSAARRSGRGRGGGDHREAEHPHERLGGVGGRAPAVALPAVLFHRASRAASLLDPPVEDHAPAARGFLAGLEVLGEIRHGAADDHEVAGRRTQPGPGRRPLDGARAPPDGARSHGCTGSRGARTARAFHPRFEDAKGGSEHQALSAASPPTRGASRPRGQQACSERRSPGHHHHDAAGGPSERASAERRRFRVAQSTGHPAQCTVQGS